MEKQITEKQTKENPIALRSKKALAQALMGLMEERPYAKITISDITSRAGLVRQTFYTNFSVKDDIIKYMLNELFFVLKEESQQKGCDTRAMLQVYYTYWENHAKFLRLLFDNRIGYLFLFKNREYHMEGVLDEKMQYVPTEERPYICAVAAGFSYELLRQWIGDGCQWSAKQLTAFAYRLLHGWDAQKEQVLDSGTRVGELL